MANHEMRVERVEVVGLAAKRRQYSLDEKAQITEESFRSSVAAVCRRYSLAPRLVYTWRSRYKGLAASDTVEDLPLASAPTAIVSAPALPALAGATPGFVHVATLKEEGAPLIRVKISGAVLAEFPMDMDPRRLAAVVRALRD